MLRASSEVLVVEAIAAFRAAYKNGMEGALDRLLDDVERGLIAEALRSTSTVKGAAEWLGVKRPSLYAKLRRLGLSGMKNGGKTNE